MVTRQVWPAPRGSPTAAPRAHPRLRIEQNARHGGADVVKQQVEQAADWLALVLTELGMTGARWARALGEPSGLGSRSRALAARAPG